MSIILALTLLLGLQIIHDLCWGFKKKAEEYDAVFFTANFDLPEKLRFQHTLEKPEEAMTFELGTTTGQSQRLMDLKKHPRYPVNIQGPLLPGEEDRLVLQGYEFFVQKLDELDGEYQKFQPSQDVGDLPTSRNAVVSSSPGIGRIKPIIKLCSRAMLANGFAGKTCFGDYPLIRRLAEEKPTVIQPYQIGGGRATFCLPPAG